MLHDAVQSLGTWPDIQNVGKKKSGPGGYHMWKTEKEWT